VPAADGAPSPRPAAPAPGSAPPAAADAVATREDALRQLEHLAEFFRRTEPQSPLSYTLADAVRRARLPLPDLLTEVMGDDSSRAALLSALGIRPGSE
jgi:type VI secretion system protein ImpA